jgi:hypothetical protein
MKNLILTFTCLGLLSACAPNSPKRQSPIEGPGSAELAAEVKTYDLTPKVDILVVVDNSMSMKIHQENLSKNIAGFVKGFADNQLLDFHFGVVPIWDSVHFDKDVHGQTVRKHFPLGHLLPLKNPDFDAKNPSSKEFLDGDHFISKATPNYVEVMKKTLLVGEDLGPAFEELFTPVLPALSEELAAGDNKGFYRKDAFLIVIFISDTDDAKIDISPNQLALDLIQMKDGDASKVSVVGVLSPSSDMKCEKDAGGVSGPVRVEELIARTNGKELDLCSKDFGDGLAKIGRDLSVKVPKQIIRLPSIPDYSPALYNADVKKDKSLQIYTGSVLMKKAVAPNFEDGWSYDPSNQSISIGSETQISGQLKISYTPVRLYNAAHARVNVK